MAPQLTQQSSARQGLNVIELTLVLLLVGLVLMVAFRFRPNHDHSPFTIYGVAPGMSLAELTSAVEKRGGSVECRAPGPDLYHTCALRLPGDPGSVLTLLDPKSRVIVFHARGVIGQLGFAAEADTAQSSWSRVTAGASVPPLVEFGDTGVVRWTAANRRWTAELHYSGLADPDPPMGIVLVDRQGVAHYAAHSEQAKEEAKRSGWIPPTAEEAAAAVDARKSEASSNYGGMSATLAILRDLETAHHNEHKSFTDDMAALPGLHIVGGARLEILTATDSGWTARTTHPALPGISCVAYGGRVPQDDRPVTAGGQSITWVEGSACDSLPHTLRTALRTP